MKPEWPKRSDRLTRAEAMDQIVEWMKDRGVHRLSFPDGVSLGSDLGAAFEIELQGPPPVGPVINVEAPELPPQIVHIPREHLPGEDDVG